MKIKAFEEKLLRLGKYSSYELSSLDENVSYDFFCFVKFKNKILHSFEKNLNNKSLIEEYNKKESIQEFLIKLNFKQLNDYNKKDIEKMEFIVYLIPREENTKKDYFILNSLRNTIIFSEGENANWINLLKRFNKHISSSYIIYSIIVSIIFIIFTSINYIVLYESGLPLNKMGDLNILFSIYGYYSLMLFFIPISYFFDFCQKIIENKILFSPYSIYFFLTIFSLKYVILKTRGFYKYISIKNEWLPLLYLFFKPAILTIISFIVFMMFSFIYSFIYDSINGNNLKADISGKSFIFKNYHETIGYPKILTFNNISYILVYKSDEDYFVYNLIDTIKYITNINNSINEYLSVTKEEDKSKIRNKNIEKFCRNIKTLSEFNENKILYEILAQSPISKPKNYLPLNIKDIEKPIITPYNFESLNLKYDEIIENCNKLLKLYK